MARVTDAETTSGRNHTLLVGPRGSGKTHLVSLVSHRTRDLAADGHRLQVAWLPEDPWTIASYDDLVGLIVNLAISYLEAGRTNDAIDIRLGVVAARERILGTDHPHTIRSRANLTQLRRVADAGSDGRGHEEAAVDQGGEGVEQDGAVEAEVT